MDPLQTYLRELLDIRSSGADTPEISYYTPLANLFNEIGKKLKPKIRCIMNLKNLGGGLPDGGFFTPDQFQKGYKNEPLPGQIPSRGVIEVKPTSNDAWVTAEGEQVSRYCGKYRQILVTNYRDFLLIGQDSEGKIAKLEAYRLAESEAEFWKTAIHPRKMAEVHGDRFLGYLKRVMLHAAPLATPEDVAWFLASYARDARARIEATDLPALFAVRTTLEEALGLKFTSEKGEHFFRSTLVQTLFYGVFSAWVLWSKQHPQNNTSARFDWRMAAWSLRVPMIKALFEEVATPTKLDPLGLVEVLDWTGATLNRVARLTFFSKFEEGHAVQYFYEPFLNAFDPELRKELGVWFTPPEIVQYMVTRADRILREELNLPDGLADSHVYVLDPCCGTGAYLVEVLKRIYITLQKKGGDALISQDIKRAAIQRVFGFEILTAPFVVAHLQLGLFLQNLGVPLSEDKNERVGVFLTNALTGWEPPKEPKTHLLFPELEQERDSAEEVKREKPILVILGNPPYNAFAGVSPEEEQGLVEPYKEGLISNWNIKKFNLDDLYVRFYRLAERRITEMTGKGVVCYISNFSYLSDPSFTVMRERFLERFDKFWFDCMNGDSRETGKRTPDGKPDPSVFSTEYNRAGIRVGTAIGIMVCKGKGIKEPIVRFRHFWGVTKRTDLLRSLAIEDLDAQYELARPSKSNRYSFRPLAVNTHYNEWPKVVELSSAYPFNGPIERRGNSLIVFPNQKLDLEANLKAYLDPEKSNAEVRAMTPRFLKSSGEFKATKTRDKLKGKVKYDATKITRYPFKPFDVRLAYLDNDIQPLFSRPSPELIDLQSISQNAFFITRDTADKRDEGTPFFFSRLICDYDCISGHARHFPFLFRSPTSKRDSGQIALLREAEMAESLPRANLSEACQAYLANLKSMKPNNAIEYAQLIWFHALAIGYSPDYRFENADGIRTDWPRIPLPKSQDLLKESANMGRKVAGLLDTEGSVPGVTSGIIRSELKLVSVISRVDGGNLDPNVGDLAITAGWGYVGKSGIIMPGKGKVFERDYARDEFDAIRETEERISLAPERILQQLGEKTYDVYLNETAYWKNVPGKVWNYAIGGYQVIKKWLSYRELDVLKRSLTIEECREVRDIARRIAAILLMESALDANYKKIKEAPFAWPDLEIKQ